MTIEKIFFNTSITKYRIGGKFRWCFHGLKHNCESFTAKQAPQEYLIVQI